MIKRILVLGVLLIFSQKAGFSQSAADLYASANGKFIAAGSEKDYKEAVSAFEKAVGADTTSALAYAGLSKSYAMLGRIAGLNFRDEQKIDYYKKAAKTASKANKLNKESAEVSTALAFVYRQLGQRDNLIRAASKAIALNSKSAEAFDLLADAYSESFFPIEADLDSSIMIRKKSVEVDPGFAKGYRGLGDDYLEQEDLDRAEASYKKAIEIAPKHAGSHDRLGSVYYRKGQFDKAKQEFTSAITLDPKNTLGYTHLGDVLFDEGLFKEAFLKYTYAVDLNANAAYAYNSMAWMYLTAKDKSFRNTGSAIENGVTAVGLSNFKNAQYLYNAAEGYYLASFDKKELADTAMTYIKMAIALDPGHVEYQEALNRFQSKEKNREYIYSWKRGERLMRNNRTVDAVREFADAAEKNGDFIPNLISYSLALKKQGDLKGASAKLDLARKADKTGQYSAMIDAAAK